MKHILAFSIFCFFSHVVNGQTSDSILNKTPIQVPIPIEALATDKAVNFQTIINKKFSGQDHFGFFAVANLLNRYDNDKEKNEFMVLTMANYQLFNKISFNAGIWANNIVGVRPTLGFSYTQISKNYLLVYTPRIDLTQDHNIENVLIFEYYPKINKNWSLYSRIQAMYNHNIAKHSHDRSYLYLRLGTAYKNLRFGLGSNIDYYGPDRIGKVSFGVFIGTQLF